MPPNLLRVNDAARRSRQARFTALLHHVDVGALERAFWRLRRAAAPGRDVMTVQHYVQDLQGRLRDLCDWLHSRRYRAQPVRRVYVAKADGGNARSEYWPWKTRLPGVR